MGREQPQRKLKPPVYARLLLGLALAALTSIILSILFYAIFIISATASH